ncbi:MAG: 5'/3'-nucleotidase SurE [Gammaproteobacteria bacterium]
MRILLSNDDGVYAEGLRVLHKSLSTIGHTDVVAPDRNRSGASNSLTLSNPLRARQLENGFFSVEGTPTDCVHLALTGLLAGEHDMVVSGINAGANLGDDVLYSGTVAAAMEGRFLGLPSIAISLVGRENNYYETAGVVAKLLVTRLQVEPLPASTILNVNVPDLPLSELRGFSIARLGTRHKAEEVYKTSDPRGEPIFWFGPAGNESDAGPGTDFHAVKNGYVSITPILLDLTHYQAFEQLSGWANGLSW